MVSYNIYHTLKSVLSFLLVFSKVTWKVKYSPALKGGKFTENTAVGIKA